MGAADVTYCTQEDFEAYVEGWVTTDPDALKRLLQRAERDIDNAVGNWPRDETTGHKFDPATLLGYQVDALSRATCAQAEYRNSMGDEFFVRAQHAAEQGPDFSTTGRLPYVGPKVWMELEGTGLLRLTTGFSNRTNRPPWHDFVYNDTSWDYDPPPLPRRT